MKRETERRLSALESTRQRPHNEAEVVAIMRQRLDDPATSDHRRAVIRAVMEGRRHA
ncbi:MAG: hypothetical protein L0J54_10650 [Halomonas sp.]|nr:hypothetical protein [Halomonas sp.]MDN6298461.1 hypothetical protein [Halomonas sp.]